MRRLEDPPSASARQLRPHALAATLAWERAHPPDRPEAAPADYAAEASALRVLGVSAAASYEVRI